MIIKMTAYSFILLSGDKELFLDKLQDLGIVDVTRSSKPVDAHSEQLLARIGAINDEISIIRRGTDQHLEHLLADRQPLAKEVENLTPWGRFDMDKLRAIPGIDVRFHVISAKAYKSEWEKDYAIEVIERTSEKVFFVSLNAEDFPVAEIPAPSRPLAEAEAELAAKDAEIAAYREKLAERKEEIPELESKLAAISVDLDRYLAGESVAEAAEGTLCIFRGFAPSEDDDKVAAAVADMDVLMTSRPACAADNPPIQLKNNAFARQFEVLTGMYGKPCYDEFDPTPIVAPFFLLFFSICMGDAGYGILLVIIAELLKRMKGGLADMYKLVRFLGIGTFIVGIFMGTFFGMSIKEMSFLPDAVKNLVISGKIPGTAFDVQMILALVIGILHICLAMIVKTACYTKKNGFRESVSTWGWTLLMVGGVIVAACTLGGLLGGEALKWIVIGLGAVSALGIFVFNKPGRNPLLNIGAGLWDTYQMVSGLLGDILSYVRLYALGLAGGMLGSAFNDLAGMVLGSNPTWQYLFFVVVLLIGHSLNLAMSCLGAFVHPLRLNFVEYFKNAGYEGQGVDYKPLTK